MKHFQKTTLHVLLHVWNMLYHVIPTWTPFNPFNHPKECLGSVFGLPPSRLLSDKTRFG